MKEMLKAKESLVKAYSIRRRLLGPDDEATLAVSVWIHHYGWGNEL